MGESQASPDHDESPERLLAMHLAGDEPAFEKLVGLYEEKLFAFIARFTGDRHLAEDVFQQTFIKVAKNAAAFDGRASFSTWLYRIARNTAVDELRRRRHDPRHVDPETGGLEWMPDASARAPLDRMAREELSERVRAALAALPDPQREAFLLREEAELDFGRIGVIMNCGRETAKSRFRLAVAKLREMFGDDSGPRASSG